MPVGIPPTILISWLITPHSVRTVELCQDRVEIRKTLDLIQFFIVLEAFEWLFILVFKHKWVLVCSCSLYACVIC